MHKMFAYLISILVLLAIAGCAALPGPAAPQSTDVPKGPLPTTGGAVVRPPFLDALQADLAKQLGVPVDQLVLEEVRAAEWSDSCLGLGGPAESCLQAITPGFLLVFSTPKGRLEVRTDQSGQSVRQVMEDAQSGDKPVSLTWQRTGGIAGICQRVMVYTDSSYRMVDCKTEAILAEGQLPAEAQAKLSQWLGQFSDFTWTSPQPAGAADMFNDELSFNGGGATAPTAEQQTQIAAYLAELAGGLGKK